MKSIDKSYIKSIWRENYYCKPTDNSTIRSYDEIIQLARLLSPGNSYYYILNLNNLEISHFTGDYKNILGLGDDDISLENILTLIHQKDYEGIHEKEKLIAHFRHKKIDLSDLSDYKVVHFFEINDRFGNAKVIMHQTIPISLNTEGRLYQIAGIHSDVTHLSIAKDQSVSFISLRDNTSFYSVDPKQGFLSEETESSINDSLSNILTNRETLICRLISEGLTSSEISDRLEITTNTVNTHRRTILKKTNCYNSSELIHKFFTC